MLMDCVKPRKFAVLSTATGLWSIVTEYNNGTFATLIANFIMRYACIHFIEP